MEIRSLEIRDIRNLAQVQLEVGSGLNLFQGPNGSGKTALLESIHLLGRGRSFRTSRLAEVVRYGQSGFQVIARIEHGRDGSVVTGVARQGADLSLRYGGRTVSQMSDHARNFPLSLSTPASQELLLGSPKVRRRWLDWGLFHVEQAYLADWRDYHRALRQRNHLLKKSSNSAELDAFETSMSQFSTKITAARRRFVDHLSSQMSDLASRTVDWPIQVALHPGWDTEVLLRERLAASRNRDADSGHTRHGPHRADLQFLSGDHDAGAAFSRGQTKYLAVLMALALARVIQELGGEAPVLLLDDPFAELDYGARKVLLELISGQGHQSFVSLPDTERNAALDKASVFHVKRGQIGKMVE